MAEVVYGERIRYVPGRPMVDPGWNFQMQQHGQHAVQRQVNSLKPMTSAVTSPLLSNRGSHSYSHFNRLTSPQPPLDPRVACRALPVNHSSLVASPGSKSGSLKTPHTASKPSANSTIKSSKEVGSRTRYGKGQRYHIHSEDISESASYASHSRQRRIRCRSRSNNSNVSLGGSTTASESDPAPNVSDWRRRLANLFSVKSWARANDSSVKPDDSRQSHRHARSSQDMETETRSRFVDCWESCSPCISVENPLPRGGLLSSPDIPTTIDIRQREDLRRLELLKDKLKRVQRRINQREEDRIINKHHTKGKRKNESLSDSSRSGSFSEMSVEEETRISADDLSFVQFVRNFATSSPVKQKEVHPSFPAKLFSPTGDCSDISWDTPIDPRRDNSAVFLRVYDISEGMAKSWSRFLICSKVEGIWHSGLMAFGYEYFYCDGVMRMLPRDVEETYAMNLRKVHYLGESTRGKHEFERFLNQICSIFSEDTYDILEWNCNDFTNLCSMWLMGGSSKAEGSRLDSSSTCPPPMKLSSVQECRYRRMRSICGVSSRRPPSPRDYHFIPSYVLEQPETLERLPVGKLALACVRLTNRTNIRRKIDEAINNNNFAIMCRNTVLRMQAGMASALSIVRTETVKTVQRTPWCC